METAPSVASGSRIRAICEGVMADIVHQRAAPRVYLFDRDGTPVAWPPGLASIPEPAAAFVSEHFAGSTADARSTSRVFEPPADSMIVHVVPYRAENGARYAVIVERLAERDFG